MYFWIIKILTTAMGEALADFMALRYSPVLAGVVGTAVFAVAMVLQFRARRYRVWIYWFAVAMVAVWGTLAADGLHIKLGVPYALSSAFFAVCLVVVFVAWYATERTLSIHSITTRRRELFYWATVLRHVRARHRGRRPDRDHLAPGLPDLGAHVHRAHLHPRRSRTGSWG